MPRRRGEDVPEPSPWGGIPGHRTIWPTPLQADLLRATLLSDERALAAWQRIRPQLDVAAMDYSTHALLPQLRANLIALGNDDPLLRLFKGVHRFAWARNQILLAQVMPIVAALQRAGLPTLLLKGAALLADQRQDAGMRQMSDIDVLVPPAAAAAAVEVILDHGLHTVEDLPLWYVTDYLPLFRPGVNFSDGAEGQLDLHWHALRSSCHRAADEDFWAASVPVALRGVDSRALCPADLLLLVIMHGLRWSPTPTYRWVLDATLIARGVCGPVDFDRLAIQARRHRLAPAVRAGLRYLRRIAEVEVPDDTLRALLVVAPLQRLELRAQATQPSRRSVLGQAATVQGQYLRRRVPPGARVTPVTHLRLAGERLGIHRLADVRHLRPGGRPGPSRPYAETAAPIGTGSCAPPPVRWDVPLDFGDPGTAREHCRYGLWLPHGWGCWIAGREARLALTLPEPAGSSLLLELAAGGVSERGPRQRLHLLLHGEPVGSLVFDAGRPGVNGEAIVLPARIVRQRSCLELVLRVPDAASPARLGINDDQRILGVFLQRLTVRRPLRCPPGDHLAFGTGTEDERMLAGGWADAEPGGRWTYGPVARLLLRTGSAPTMLEWNADPLLAPGAPRLSVDVAANGVALGAVDCDGGPCSAQMALGKAATNGELLLSWRIRDPRSPSQLGLSEDPRPLGLFFRSVALH